jgi:hypothetical protein
MGGFIDKDTAKPLAAVAVVEPGAPEDDFVSL